MCNAGASLATRPAGGRVLSLRRTDQSRRRLLMGSTSGEGSRRFVCVSWAGLARLGICFDIVRLLAFELRTLFVFGLPCLFAVFMAFRFVASKIGY